MMKSRMNGASFSDETRRLMHPAYKSLTLVTGGSISFDNDFAGEAQTDRVKPDNTISLATTMKSNVIGSSVMRPAHILR
jgi:hypothetical protein